MRKWVTSAGADFYEHSIIAGKNAYPVVVVTIWNTGGL
jgi:hypothetical protein